MRNIFLILFVLIFGYTAGAQSVSPSKKELMEYLRTKLISYPDEYYTYKEITLDVEKGTMTFQYMVGSYQVIYFENLDASSLRNDDGFISSSARRVYGKFLITPIAGKTGRIWYKEGSPDITRANVAELFYDNNRLLKGNPDLVRIEKTIKALILACGGKESKELF